MILTQANIRDLKKVTAKISCSNQSEGTGTIILVDGVLYVLTAAHVIEKDTKDGHLAPEQIGVSITRNSQRYVLFVDEVWYDRPNDAAVMRVSNPDEMPTSGLDKVRLLTTSVDGASVLCGYHKGENTPKRYLFEQRGERSWAIANIELKLQSLEPVPNFEGTSGGGLFYQDADSVLYMAAYMSGVGKYDGNNNEFDCFPSSNFLACGFLNALVESRDYEYVADSGLASNIDSKQLLKPLDRSGYELNQTGLFIENDRTREIITQMRDDDELTILLTALSGMGKTKLIYEAFKGTEREPNRYYAKYSGHKEQLIGEFKTLLCQNSGNDGIVIVDDCPMELVTELFSIRNQYNGQFRLIMAHHDYFNEGLKYIDSFPVIRFKPEEMVEVIGRYISDALGENQMNRNDVDEIKKLADGYPQMAVRLVEIYKKNKAAGPEAVADLMPKLLDFTPGEEYEEKAIMQTFSLCLPFPYKEATHEGFELLMRDNLFTQLNGIEYERRRSIAARLVEKYSPTLIDSEGMWLYVRPFPLAVWLTAEWFKNVCNTQVHFKDIIDKIRQQPQWVQNAISEGFCKHIQQMSGNKEAFKMVDKLVNADVSHPFFNEENLCSGLGSKLFLAMSTVNPAAMASSLRRVLGGKEIGWLKEVFEGEGRRNVVWALERLCFASESYRDGVSVLARLAMAENENSISNNATGQLVQLFHIVLAGTEVDLKERLQTLRELMLHDGEHTQLIARCFDAAFRNGGFVKTGGAEKFGFENRKDYSPQTWNEIFEYWYGCRDLLLQWLDNKPDVTEQVARIVEENVYQWSRGGQRQVLVPLMEKIAQIKGYCWDAGYEALAKTVYTFGIDGDALGVSELMAKLRNSSFKTALNEARYKLHGKYHLGDKEQLALTKELFDPLADEFLERKVYSNETEVTLLLDDKEYIPIEFVIRLTDVINDEQLACLFQTIADALNTKPKEFYSSFLGNLVAHLKERKQLTDFLENLRNKGRYFLYVSLMAGTENEELSHFNQLVAEQKKGVLDVDFLPIYLRFFRSYGETRYLQMLKALRLNFPERPNDLVAYVEAERFMMRKDEHPEAVVIVKEALVNYQIDGDNGRLLNDYSRFLIETLKQWHDVDFAKKINEKMIAVYNTQMVHLSTEGIFTELLKDYFNDVWPEFVKAFLGQDTFLFYYQVKDELGSGFGFGKGSLFEVDEGLIKQMCMDNPETAPARIASMVPCFEAKKEGEEIKTFSPWVLWLLDNFGNQKDVRSNISGNLGSFSWTGNVSPYYERNIRCFEKLLGHKFEEVREWAQRSINDERKLLEMEKTNEDFMKIRYGM